MCKVYLPSTFAQILLREVVPHSRPIVPCLSISDYALMRRAIGCQKSRTAKKIRGECPKGTSAQGVDSGTPCRTGRTQCPDSAENRGRSRRYFVDHNYSPAKGAGVHLEQSAVRGLKTGSPQSELLNCNAWASDSQNAPIVLHKKLIANQHKLLFRLLCKHLP